MRFTFIWVGRTKNRNWANLENDYLSRIEHFVRCRIRVVREIRATDQRDGNHLEREAQSILKNLDSGAHTILLNERGRIFTSRELADWIDQRQNEGIKELAFILGGAAGVAESVTRRVNLNLALSTLTFPHEMARVILLEQLYRSFSLLHGLPYPR